MINIALIGAGQLGSRHLQALAKLKRPVSIHVVDPSEEALKTAESRFQEVSQGFEGNCTFYRQLDQLPTELEIVIVATGSKPRRALIEQLVAAKTIRFMILEKFLFTKQEDFPAVASLLAQHNIKAWVNCPRRQMEWYQQLRKDIQGPIHFFATGNEWGLGCNGIHLVDLFVFLGGEQNVRLTHELIDKEIQESKRPGYVEFTGTITGYAGMNSFHISSFRGTPSPLHIHIHTPTVRYSIQEGANAKVWIARAATNWAWEETGFNMPFQSQLTHLAVEEILLTGNCSLTAYEESARLHRHFLANLLQFMNEQHNEPKLNECLIT